MDAGRNTREFWEALCSEFEETGGAHAAFCAAKGVKVYTFQSWLYRLRRERRAPARVRVLPVKVRQAPSAPKLVELSRSGVLLRFEAGTDEAYLARLLCQVERTRC